MSKDAQSNDIKSKDIKSQDTKSAPIKDGFYHFPSIEHAPNVTQKKRTFIGPNNKWYIQEKIDGSQTSFKWDGKQLRFYCRIPFYIIFDKKWVFNEYTTLHQEQDSNQGCGWNKQYSAQWRPFVSTHGRVSRR